jgi:plastocyanin
MVGFHYSTNSTLTPRYPNEWEFFGRYAFLSQDAGAPLDVAAQLGYNLAAEGVDGEISAGDRFGRVRLLGAARVLSDPGEAGGVRVALAGGGTVRLHRFIALAADVASLLDRENGEDVAWSAGVHLAIPNTPHTLSLQATNTNTATLQGASRGDGDVRYGFEFVVPITLARYFGRRPAEAPPRPPPAATPPARADTAVTPAPADTAAADKGAAVSAGIRNFNFTPPQIEVAAGTTITWQNQDQVQHTVTADDNSWDSGPIEPGASWSHTFDKPGTYPFHCTPHPFMQGAVVVR